MVSPNPTLFYLLSFRNHNQWSNGCSFSHVWLYDIYSCASTKTSACYQAPQISFLFHLFTFAIYGTQRKYILTPFVFWVFFKAVIIEELLLQNLFVKNFLNSTPSFTFFPLYLDIGYVTHYYRQSTKYMLFSPNLTLSYLIYLVFLFKIVVSVSDRSQLQVLYCRNKVKI